MVHTRLAKQNLIDFRPDSTGTSYIEYYLDYAVHVSDQTTAIAGVNRVRYHNYLFGANAIGWAEVPVDKPVETKSEPAAGDGMGTEELWMRRQFAMHPYGVKWTDSAVGGEFPTNAELALAVNWDRVYSERKQIPIAVLITNG